MPYEPNDQNYQTSNSRIASFNDFNSNLKKEKEELKKVGRSTVKNNDETHQLPGNRRLKFNRDTRKMDDLSKGEVKDKLDSIKIEDTKHKWKANIPEQQGKNESNVIKETIGDENESNRRILTVRELIKELSMCDQNA